jgi:hypothetical protein
VCCFLVPHESRLAGPEKKNIEKRMKRNELGCPPVRWAIEKKSRWGFLQAIKPKYKHEKSLAEICRWICKRQKGRRMLFGRCVASKEREKKMFYGRGIGEKKHSPSEDDLMERPDGES